MCVAKSNHDTISLKKRVVSEELKDFKYFVAQGLV